MLLLLADLSSQVKTWQEIFGGGPLAAFLGLMIVALVTIFGLYVRSNGKLLTEKDDHAKTIRAVTELAGAMSNTWAEQLRKDADQLQAQERATELQRQTLETLSRSVNVAEWLRTQQPIALPPGTRTP